MKNNADIGVQIGEILLPDKAIDLHRWAVIACDQFTSEPEYWQKVKNIVGDAPSTLNMILPEVYLGTGEEAARIQSTQAAMRQYLAERRLVSHKGFILVERATTGENGRQHTRHGLMMALDLERYDFTRGSQSLIRATEGTILERLPPRIRIREGAPLELPHILVLIDDPERTVIEPVVAEREALRPLYDTELMLGSGRLRGSLVVDPAQETRVLQALRKLMDPQRFQAHYGIGPDKGVLLFAVGDGNHSLATAKSIWEKIKARVGMEHPARYALVEVENVHDEGLAFEPIHRVLFGARLDWRSAMEEFYGAEMRYSPSASAAEMIKAVDRQDSPGHSFGVITSHESGVVSIPHPASNLPVGTLQAFLDGWLKQGGAQQIDYVHGKDVLQRLGAQENNLGYYLPAMDKGELFKTVILDGSLPRKTFSMGEAHEKRFYMESRKIA
jgi:hypothetical protein